MSEVEPQTANSIMAIQQALTELLLSSGLLRPHMDEPQFTSGFGVAEWPNAQIGVRMRDLNSDFLEGYHLSLGFLIYR